MPAKKERVVLDDDVLMLTVKGQQELMGAGTALSREQLEVMVLIDGKATAAETASRVPTLERSAAMAVLSGLLRDDLADFTAPGDASLDFVDFFQPRAAGAAVAASAQQKKQAAATALLLQQKGYSVRIARRRDRRPDGEVARQLAVLVVEDEQHLSDLLKHVLAAEGYAVRTAKNRDEIVVQIRTPPRPDLILLDVLLPDADGFDVLSRIRQHPALKATPVVMLTGQATRGAVLKGLTGGADGYITKPFQIDVLSRAVRAVLGFPDEDHAAGQDDIWSGQT